MHIFQPTAVRERVTEITPQFLQSLGVRALLLDVDNTLATYTSHAPSPGALEWVKAMGEAGFRMIIISNNFTGRVGSFGAVFGLDTLSFALKPLPVGYLRAAKRLRVKPQECVIIGSKRCIKNAVENRILPYVILQERSIFSDERRKIIKIKTVQLCRDDKITMHVDAHMNRV